MQTDASVESEESPIVRLKNGTQVSRHLRNRVLSMRSAKNGALLFNDLVMRCHDLNRGEEIHFMYFDGSISHFGTLGFLQPDGNVYPTVREIVLDLAD